MPVLPDWPASPPTVRCRGTSRSTVTLLVGGERPWLTPTETPGAMDFPALSAVPPVALPLAALGFRVPVAGPVGPEPNLHPVEPEPAAQPVEHTRPAACEGGGRGSELQPFARGDLADPAVEQHSREDLVFRYDLRRAPRDSR